MGVEIYLRLLLSAVLGGAIGLEREVGERPAGFRTHILVSLGSCLMMIVSFLAYDQLQMQGKMQGDPLRLASNVVTGIGFLGAGAIIRMGASVRGLTTAATLWTTSGIGLAIGAGLYGAGVMTTFIVLTALVLLRRVEGYWNMRKRYATFRVTLKTTEGITSVCHILRGEGRHIRRLEVASRGAKAEMLAFLVASDESCANVMAELLRLGEVEKVEKL